jgi:hypothetical protein
MNLTSKLTSILFFLFFLIVIPADAQESKVNQRRIDREREQKRKTDLKQYDKAVKRHHKMQSKDTKASMKRSKKESKKVTPIKR